MVAQHVDLRLVIVLPTEVHDPRVYNTVMANGQMHQRDDAQVPLGVI